MRTLGNSPFGTMPPVVKNLLIINVLLFIAKSMIPGLELDRWLSIYYPDSGSFKVWQIVTYMFMHHDFMHIFFNMFALYTFGTTLEYIMGSKRFLNFYLLTGIGAYVLQAGIQAFELHQIIGSVRIPADLKNLNLKELEFLPASLNGLPQADALTVLGISAGKMVGASGAVMGLLVAFGMLLPNAELMLLFLPVPIKAKYFIPIYILLELSLGVYKIPGDSIAHFAHLGGALFGFILTKAWGLKRPGGYI